MTDALLVLGYIDPKKFLGGKMALDLKAARDACGVLAVRLGLDTERVAWGIRELAITEMVRALRAEFARHGCDSRDYSLVSMGGCGGLFNAVVAQQIGLSRVLMPELTSVLSAFGAASADVRRERSLSIGRILPMRADELQSLVDGLCMRTVADLDADGIARADRGIAIELDLRFMRQQWELAIPANDGFDEKRQRDVISRFTAEYARRYGQGALVSGAPVEVATVRVIGTGRTVRPSLLAERESLLSRPKPSGNRVIVVERFGDMAREDIPTYERDALHPGCTLDGPALVDAVDTTLWVPDRCVAHVDAYRTLNLELSR